MKYMFVTYSKCFLFSILLLKRNLNFLVNSYRDLDFRKDEIHAGSVRR